MTFTGEKAVDILAKPDIALTAAFAVGNFAPLDVIQRLELGRAVPTSRCQNSRIRMASLSPRRTALIVVDVQKAFDEWEAAGNRRNNPDAVERIVRLLADFRAKQAPVIHIRHASLHPTSRFRPDQSGFDAKDEVREQSREPVIVKQVNSAFIGTDLEARLRQMEIENVIIVGATTNHCVETTTRMAGNLGFKAKLVRDATWTFDREGADGELYTADQVHAMSLANLKDEFAEIVTTDEVMRRLGAT
jgi:nicotinamidase-related amidase